MPEQKSEHPQQQEQGVEKTVSRREFLRLAGIAGAVVTLGAGLGGVLGGCGSNGGAAGSTETTAAGTTTVSVNKEKPTMVLALLGLTEWGKLVLKGAEARTQQLGIELATTNCNFDANKQIADVRSMIAKYGTKGIFTVSCVDPIVGKALSKELDGAKCLYQLFEGGTQVAPWDSEYYVACFAADDYGAGYAVATESFKKLNGKGTFVELGGGVGTVTGADRTAGIMAAAKEFPDMKLLESQAVEKWDPAKTQELVEAWCTKYEMIDAIMAANDGMALGAIKALRSQQPGWLGKTVVSGMNATVAGLNAQIAGDLYADAWSPASWVGFGGCSMTYDAYMGTYDFKNAPKEMRAFRVKFPLVMPQDAAAFLKSNVEVVPPFDTTNYKELYSRPYMELFEAQGVTPAT